MQLLIISDTHLQNDLLKKITDHYPDMDYYIHCGDSSLRKDDPLLKKYLVVKGNHDKLGTFDTNIIFKVKNYNCLITHGNNFNIYYGTEELVSYMKKNNLDIAFHGHTHVPAYSIVDNKLIINPGSVMINRGSYGFGTYAIVKIIENDIDVKFYHSTTFKECGEEILNDGLLMLEEFKKILK
ncbi:metallophosphoesterase family protein [Thomasclavelia sp.]